MEAFVWMNFDFSNEILPDSPESIYLQLFNIIQKQIEDGKLVPGDMLPSEMEFAAHIISAGPPSVRRFMSWS